MDLKYKNVFFLILDNFSVFCDTEKSSYFYFKDGFQLGLEFMKVLNKPRE